ncbi:MAG: ABC transporter [Alphaproteobacteria bacterium]|nr:ABC transporter [Alphaproteobacteria bacterium]
MSNIPSLTPASPSRRNLLSLGGIVLALIVFVAINVVANRTLSTTRLDLTADRLFTLSAGTKSVLAKIEEPLTLRFYFSDRLGREIPSYAVYATRIREMLQEYQTASRGKIKLEVIDPRPFSDEEDRAVGFGLQGVPVNQGGDLVYFGLAATNTADKEEVIAFFQPERERFLEYDLTKIVYNLTITKKPSVGLLTMLPVTGDMRQRPPEPWAIHSQLNQFFDLKMIERDAAAIPAEIGVLIVAHPQNLPEKTLYAIDQFVLRGGRALVFVDPHAEGEMTRPGMAAQTGLTASNLKPLFDAWGIEMVEGKVAGDRLAARRVNAGTDTRVRAVDYLAWLSLRDDGHFNRSDVLTAETGVLQLASAGVLKAKEGATTTLTPLVRTSPQSTQIEVDAVKTQPDPVKILAEFKPDNQPYILAARVAGPVKSAFPDGPPPEPKKEGEEAPANPAAAATPPAEALKESKVPANLIVVADTDLLEDRFWAQVQEFFGQRMIIPAASNGDFVVNAVDNLLGSDDLISLRTRGMSARPFLTVQELQRDAELKFRAKERELTEKLRDTEKKLSELQSQSQPQGEAGRAIVSREQQEAIEKFRADMLGIRRELRDVQHELRRDIEALDMTLKFVNIGLVPILVGIAAIIVGVVRVRRRAPARRAVAAGTA